MSNEELKVPGLKSFWLRNETGDGEYAGYIVEVLSCDKVSEFDDTILVTSQRTDGDRSQIRLTLKVFHDLFFPRSIPTSAGKHSQDAGHVNVVPEIHEAKMLRDQVERQKAHIRNIEGALTGRNERIKQLELANGYSGPQLAMQKVLLDFVEAFDKIPATSIRCLGPDFQNLIDARYAIPIPVPIGPKREPGESPSSLSPEMVGVVSEATLQRLRKGEYYPERIFATLDHSKKDTQQGNHYKLYLGPCVPQCKLEATECEGRVFEAERALAEMKAKIESGEITRAAAEAINLLADAQNEAYEACAKAMGFEVRVKELEAEKEDAWAHAFDESKVTEDLEKETANREHAETQRDEARHMIFDLHNFVSGSIHRHETLEESCQCIKTASKNLSAGRKEAEKVVEQALSLLCNCDSNPGEIHAPMCFRRAGLTGGIEGLKKLVDIGIAKPEPENETQMTSQELERLCARHQLWKTKIGVERLVLTFALEEDVVRYERCETGTVASLRKENFLRLYELAPDVPQDPNQTDLAVLARRIQCADPDATPVFSGALNRTQAIAFYELLLDAATTRAFLYASLPLGLPKAELFCYVHSGDSTSTPCDHVSDLLQDIGAKLRRDRPPTPQPRKDPDK